MEFFEKYGKEKPITREELLQMAKLQVLEGIYKEIKKLSSETKKIKDLTKKFTQ